MRITLFLLCTWANWKSVRSIACVMKYLCFNTITDGNKAKTQTWERPRVLKVISLEPIGNRVWPPAASSPKVHPISEKSQGNQQIEVQHPASTDIQTGQTGNIRPTRKGLKCIETIGCAGIWGSLVRWVYGEPYDSSMCSFARHKNELSKSSDGISLISRVCCALVQLLWRVLYWLSIQRSRYRFRKKRRGPTGGDSFRSRRNPLERAPSPCRPTVENRIKTNPSPDLRMSNRW